ncbi:MAG: hypothetical protein N2Z74_08540, partial [Syntrophales bacterium]|nr:hypothetical protein [Syntrophales bacterium]
MNFHTPTIAILSIIIDLVLLFILLHAWRTRTVYAGFVAWLTGTACWTAGSFLNLLMAHVQPLFIPRIIGIALLLAHPILLYEGLFRFYGINRGIMGTPVNLGLAGLHLFVAYYGNYVTEDYALRTGFFSLVYALLFGRIALEPLWFREARKHSVQWLMSFTLIPLILLLLLRSFRHFHHQEPFHHMTAAMNYESLLMWLLLYGLVVELVIAYSYLSLTADRVERELSAARQEAEKASQAKDAFLKMVSHELRTPLAAITGVADLLVRRGRPDDELPRVLWRAAKQQERLINDLLDSAAIETGRLTITTRPFNLPLLWDEFRTTYHPRAAAKGVHYQGHRAANLPEIIVGDRQRIFQVCANLFEN